MRIERRGVGIVLAIVAAVAVVAIAARGDHVADGGAWSISSTVTGSAQAMVLILLGLLALGVVGLTVWAIFPDQRRKIVRRPRRRPSSIVGGIIVMLLFMAALSQADRRDDGDENPASRPSGLGAVGPAGDGGDPGPPPQWGLGLGGVVLLLAVVGVVALRRRGDELELPDDAWPVMATEDEQVDAIAQAQECTDPRYSVLLAFAAAEALLSADSATRRPPSTSAREWSVALRLAPLTEIVRRYEIARFSTHPVSAADRTAALDALLSLR